MRQKSVPEKEPATQVVKNLRRATRRHFSANGAPRSEAACAESFYGPQFEDCVQCARLCARKHGKFYEWLEAGSRAMRADLRRLRC
jgi:transposase